jgi:putative restriction endonuclease
LAAWAIAVMFKSMAFGVFIHRTDSIYGDVPSERYQFPKQYLTRVQQCESDWIVYIDPVSICT